MITLRRVPVFMAFLALAGSVRLMGQDTAAVRTVQRWRDSWFGDTSGAIKRLGYHGMSGLIDPVPPPADDSWSLSPTGFVIVGGQQELGLALGALLSRPLRPGPAPVRSQFSILGQYGITGSRDLTLGFAAPALVPGWRFLLLARSERMVRTPYFGPLNTHPAADSLIDLYSLLYYRYALLRSTAFATVQRQVVGPVWFHLAGQARHYRTSAIAQQPTLFAQDVAAGRVNDTTRYDGLEGRAGLLFDTRDDWSAPRSGVYFEAVAALGDLTTGAPGAQRLQYQRYLLGLREFVPLDARRRTVLGLRQRLTIASDTLPYFLAYEQLTTGLPDDGVVGPHTIRLHKNSNELASNQGFLSLDLRREVVSLRADPLNPVGIWGLVLADYAALWEPHRAYATHLNEWSLGLGARMQFSKPMLVGMDVGWTDAGPSFSFVTYFDY